MVNVSQKEESQPLTANNRKLETICVSWIPKRYILLIMVFIGFFHLYALRVLINVSIVAMTSNRTVLVNQSVQDIGPEFTWTKSEVGMILSSFFYGYVLTQIPGGIIAERFGGKYLFGGGIFVGALSVLLMPTCAHMNIYFLVCSCIVNGLFQGFVVPSVLIIWAKWVPAQEKSKFMNFPYSGSYFGTVIPMGLSGILAESRGGWPSTFYLFGGAAVVWFPLWCFLVAESPEKHTTITKNELNFIKTHRGYSDDISKKKKLPWGKMVLSTEVWAPTIGFFSNSWGFFTMVAELPSFIKFAMDFDLRKTGYLLSLVYIVSSVVVTVSSPLADFLIEYCRIKTVLVRKIYGCGGLVGLAIFSIAAFHCDAPAAAVACLTISMGFSALSSVGLDTNYLDIAPEYSSVLMGIANTLAPMAGIVSPYLTSLIVQDKYSRKDWEGVFYITAGIAMFGAVIFGIFASGSKQSWACNNCNKESNEYSTVESQDNKIVTEKQ